ncbi:Serine/threonine-protein phosphatase PGAM5, mitochondrial [Hondaea fermentalgiana]|uniref:Serine/threonine-protein phosphatase PGAM5, mitochondrial n=1 Tax=Hondaea fermentalgiana TaxID=2315210 RepID=A0A2R5FYX1_9STRA|nr:Serine/threonine-protein phosphatase PGAM5, mitochondrial [Hondaea fermentalgiana]|eukprot:GBG23956.1 Serine/threonine-protein phosphatase PGAM5, mitochondrial [Hondaea fermentalgiana]
MLSRAARAVWTRRRGGLLALATVTGTGLAACSAGPGASNSAASDSAGARGDASPGEPCFQSSGKAWDDNWDRMAEVSEKRAAQWAEKAHKSKDARPSRPCRTIVLVRHGQYEQASRKKYMENNEGLDHDWWLEWDAACKLTPLGREQATLAGKRLAEIARAHDYTYDAVYYSDQKRATETAQLILDELEKSGSSNNNNNQEDGPPAHVEQLIREGNPIQPVPASRTYKPSDVDCYEDGSRIEAAFRKHIHRAPLHQHHDTHEILVCHGNVIRYFVCRALQFDPAAWLRFAVYNTGITVIRVGHNGNVSVSAIGDTGHLPAEKVTYS